MLPILMYNNMEGGSNHNPSFSLYDDSVILNSVRSRKKTELPNCPICSCTIRQGELESHLTSEVERLQKLSTGSKRKASVNSSANPLPGSSTSSDPHEEEVDVTGCLGSDVYQRVHVNRLRRLRARRRLSPLPQEGECPVCNNKLPMSRLQRHALRCLKRTGADLDEDVPDTSSEEGSIDVENDEPSSGFGAEYQWCGEWRVRAAALQAAEARAAGASGAAGPTGAGARRPSHDQALVVDGDEDTELYGPPQYSPSRIAPEAEICQSDEIQAAEPSVDQSTRSDHNMESVLSGSGLGHKPNGLVEASAETRIQALKARIKELEKKQNAASEAKCLICLGPYISPAVSIQCWHVYCEVCWLQSLKAKKICPQCNAITTSQHLRRIYM